MWALSLVTNKPCGTVLDPLRLVLQDGSRQVGVSLFHENSHVTASSHVEVLFKAVPTTSTQFFNVNVTVQHLKLYEMYYEAENEGKQAKTQRYSLISLLRLQA